MPSLAQNSLRNTVSLCIISPSNRRVKPFVAPSLNKGYEELEVIPELTVELFGLLGLLTGLLMVLLEEVPTELIFSRMLTNHSGWNDRRKAVTDGVYARVLSFL